MDANTKPRTIARIWRKVELHNQPTDFAFWQSQPPTARLAALEEIRRECHGKEFSCPSGFLLSAAIC